MPIDKGCCVAGNTWISTDSGTYKIEDIVNNQMPVRVKCINKSGEIEYKPIVDFQRYSRRPTMKIMYNISHHADSLYCLPTHQLLTNKGFKVAEEIGYGDKLITIRGREESGKVVWTTLPVPIHSIQNGKEVPVYGIEVEDNHTFLSNGVISYNYKEEWL